MATLLELPIVERREIAEGTIEVRLGLEKNKFRFHSGQYIRVTVPHLLKEDPKGNRRDFSLASSPTETDWLAIAYRLSDSGTKQTLLHSPLGTKVLAEGPFGLFTLPQNPRRPVVLVAGGIGVTPFRSMICYVTTKHLTYRITLLYANWARKNAAYLKDLTEYQQRNPRFVLKNRFGLFTPDFIRRGVKDLQNPLWYLCGPPPMVEALQKILPDLGVSEDQIILEVFTGY